MLYKNKIINTNRVPTKTVVNADIDCQLKKTLDQLYYETQGKLSYPKKSDDHLTLSKSLDCLFLFFRVLLNSIQPTIE